MGAAERIRHYLLGYAHMTALDPDRIHGVCWGGDQEATLTVSDLEAVLAERDSLAELVRLATAWVDGDDNDWWLSSYSVNVTAEQADLIRRVLAEGGDER